MIVLGDENALNELDRAPEFSLCSAVKKPADPQELERLAFHLGEYWGSVARVPPKEEFFSTPPETTSPSPRKRSPQSDSAAPCFSRRPVEILMVDDNNDDATLFRESLREAKHIEVAEILDEAEAALSYLRRQGPFQRRRLPDLVVLDIHMPRKTGFALLDEIKSDEALRTLPVVMLTASRYEEDIWESYSRGACAFLEKPPQFERFREMAIRFANYWTLVAHLPRRESD